MNLLKYVRISGRMWTFDVDNKQVFITYLVSFDLILGQGSETQIVYGATDQF